MKNETVTFTFRISKELKEELRKQAEKENRTLSNFIVTELIECLKNKK